MKTGILFRLENLDIFSIVFRNKFDSALRLCKESVILSFADVFSGMEFCPPLAYNYFTSVYGHPSGSFYSESLSIGVPAVLGTPTTLLMCHL